MNLYWKMMECVRSVNEQLEHLLHPLCTRYEITVLQLNILLTLHMRGPQTISGLARHIHMADTNNSALCKRLEKDGFVQRNRDKKDERIVLVSLSPKGETAAQEFMKLCARHQQKLKKEIPGDKIDEIIRGTDTLLEILEKNREEKTHE